MDQRRIGGTHTIRKSLYRPLGISAKRWKTMKRKRMLRRGTRGLRPGISFQQPAKTVITNAMTNDVLNSVFDIKTKKSRLSRKQFKNITRNFKSTLRALKKQEKSKLSRIAENAELSTEDLDTYTYNIITNKLEQISSLAIPVGADARTIQLFHRLHETAADGLAFAAESTNPDISVSEQRAAKKAYKNSLKKAFILQKTYEGGNDRGFGKEQGTIAYLDFMKEELSNMIHRERPDIAANDLADILGGLTF